MFIEAFAGQAFFTIKVKGVMNMLKTVKGKVFVGTVAVGLLSGAGVALSTSSAGVNLKKWVDKKAGQVFLVQKSSQRKCKNQKFHPFSKGEI